MLGLFCSTLPVLFEGCATVFKLGFKYHIALKDTLHVVLDNVRVHVARRHIFRGHEL